VSRTDRHAKWIWAAGTARNVNQYVEFRREFRADNVTAAELCLSVDTNFVAWVNGRYVGTGQFSDFPKRKTFSRIDITNAIMPGENTLAVLAHYCGQDHFSYIPGEPGLWFTIRCGGTEIVSDDKTLCRVSPSYRQGPLARLSPQRGFTFEYDARRQDDWTALDYNATTAWASAATTNETSVPEERPLPMLSLKPRPPHRIVAQGVLKRAGPSGATVAELMQQDFMSARHSHELFDDVAAGNEELVSRSVTIDTAHASSADGVYIVVDLGREECGFIDLELEAGAGTIVDIAVGEHLADLRVRSSVGGRNFASRFITREGKQRFTHFIHRYAGRYVELHFTNIAAPLTLHYAGLIPADYPLEMRGSFSCDDSLMNRIYDVSRRTLHLCMHERYEDCPWREQALYAEDLRIEALVGYYAFGEYDFARVSLDLLGRSLQDDGYVQLCAPMRSSFTIPFATMAWLVAVAEHLLFSGSIGAAEMQLPRIRKMLDAHLARLVNGLLPTPKGKRYWHFYDWADGLTGSVPRSDEEGLAGERFDAILNFFFILALKALAGMFQACGEASTAEAYRKQAEATMQAAHEKFWDASEQAYQTYVGQQAMERHYAEMTQALALLAQVPNQDIAHGLRQRLTQEDNGLVPTTLGASIYKFDAVLAEAGDFGRSAFEMIAEEWGSMLYNGATSFWETIKGQFDFSGGGSLCHGFSTVPAYFYQAYLLGIRPVEPGFASFQVNPVFSAVPSASGTVPTPYGNIDVSWERRGKSCIGKLVHPENLKPLFVDSDIDCNWTVVSTKVKKNS